jgi:hypothetical protein
MANSPSPRFAKPPHHCPPPPGLSCPPPAAHSFRCQPRAGLTVAASACRKAHPNPTPPCHCRSADLLMPSTASLHRPLLQTLHRHAPAGLQVSSRHPPSRCLGRGCSSTESPPAAAGRTPACVLLFEALSSFVLALRAPHQQLWCPQRVATVKPTPRHQFWLRMLLLPCSAHLAALAITPWSSRAASS